MWRIGVLQNTLKLNKEIADQLYAQSEKSGDEIWWFEGQVMDKEGLITFNSEHMEHMDFLGQKKYQDILKSHNAKGDVTFGSMEGDNEGEFWGYRFDGNGGMKPLKGVIQWSENE